MARRKGKRDSPFGGPYRRETDLWTGEDWQPSPMDIYPGEDRFFQAAYKYGKRYSDCYNYDEKDDSRRLGRILRKMYEDGKRKGTDMTVARRNPVGMAVTEGMVPVRVGKGKLTHVYAPNRRGGILCESGSGRAGKKQALYDSKAKFITCYRCEKLLRNRG